MIIWAFGVGMFASGLLAGSAIGKVFCEQTMVSHCTPPKVVCVNEKFYVVMPEKHYSELVRRSRIPALNHESH
jgi:hypothetical protein